ncbi:MAG TPA: hypothetical protein VMH81_15730 [Bryobacteraceae bacterium]|nr:hypothetical protein [Bryobacteraceae bacterium]
MRTAKLLLLILLLHGLLGGQTKAPSTEELDKQIDYAYWIEVRDSNDPRKLEGYLKRFPQGVFVDLAKDKLEKLLGKTAASDSVVPAASLASVGNTKPPDALELLHKVQAAMGGADRLAAIRNYRHVEQREGVRGGLLTRSWCAAGASLEEQGQSRAYFDSKAPGWRYERGFISDLSAEVGRQDHFGDLFNLVLADRMKYAISLEGPLAIRIEDADLAAVLEIDVSTSLPHRLRGRAGNPEGSVSYDDWREVDRARLPFQRTILRDPQPAIKIATVSWKLNTDLNCLEIGRKPAGAKPAKAIPKLPAPDTASALPRKTGDTSAQALAFLKKLQERLGGFEALLNVRDYERVYTQTRPSMSGMIRLPRLMERGCITGETLQRPTMLLARSREFYFNGTDGGWSTMSGKYRPLNSGEIAASQRDSFNYDLFKMVLSDRDPARVLSMFDDATIQIVDSQGNEAQVTADPTSGLPTRKISRFVAQKGMTPRLEEQLSDWRPVQGILLPFHLKGYELYSSGAGVLVRDVEIQEWKLNSGINCAQLGARKQ